MFKKFFKPKWQSAKPQVRIQAINNLNVDDGDDLHVLDLLAKGDVEASVRSIAYQRTRDTGKLLSYIQQEKDTSAQQAGIDHLLTLLDANDDVLDSRLEVIVKGLDTQALASLVEKTKNQALGLMALEGIQDEPVLQLYSTKLSLSALRQASAERLESEVSLETVLKESKGKDKSVYRIVKNKLNVIHDAQKQLDNRDQQLEDLCKSVEALARFPFDPMYIAKLEHAKKQWTRMQSYATDDIKQRFQRASELCRQVVDASTAEENEQREANQRLREAAQERMAACEQLEEAFTQISEKEALEAEDVPAVSALLRTQQVRWDEAAGVSAPAPDERKRFNRALHELEKIISAVTALKEHGPELESVVNKMLDLVVQPSADTYKLKKAFNRLSSAISWPPSITKPELLVLRDKAASHFDHIQAELATKEKDAVEKLKGVLDNLRDETEQGHLKVANKLLKEANRHLKHLPIKQANAYQHKVRDLTVRVNELRDWQGYASAPKKEQLCESMEALVGSDMDPQALANRVKRLQSEWKVLGASPDGQAVWERFRKAADDAYEPCKEYFDNLSSVRSGNLASRKNVVEQIQGYLASLDWDGADWRAVNEVYEVAKQEWRRYSPVDRKDGKSVQDQFNGLLAQLRERLDQEFSRNEAKRKQLIETAEALVIQEDLRDAIDKAKGLQQQWKSVGLVSRREDTKLWRKFRGVCDQIFARREQEKQAASDERDKNLTDALYLCEQMEQLSESDMMDLDSCRADFDKLQKKLSDISALPKEQASDIKKRFSAASDACLSVFAGAEKLKFQDQVAELWRKVALCDELEASVMSATQAESNLGDDVEWGSELELPKGTEGIEQRYQQLISIAESGEPVADALLESNTEILKELTVLLEIEAGVDTPEEERPYRMELQVSRLSGGLSQRKNHSENQDALVTKYQRDWCVVGPVAADVRVQYTARFKAALKAFG
ncbi:hypothetical protein A9Q99_26320 [Gammaproteobacteria bacterium 45_16_T64]|nr:hypothetical protein A9Q99_26320 [Gammaproteobacteria bacterium 45_16_T64]